MSGSERRKRGRWDKEEAERGVGREEKERGQRITRLNHNSERKAGRKGQKETASLI